jgi:hypothetical protein
LIAYNYFLHPERRLNYPPLREAVLLDLAISEWARSVLIANFARLKTFNWVVLEQLTLAYGMGVEQ